MILAVKFTLSYQNNKRFFIIMSFLFVSFTHIIDVFLKMYSVVSCYTGTFDRSGEAFTRSMVAK